jgi:hypothetical protein
LLGSAPALAQDAPPLDPARVPAMGARVGDFVPGGWKVAAEIRGDLNGDGRPDRVVHIVPASSTGYEPTGVSAAPETHALLVLLSQGGGGLLRRGGVAARLLQPAVPQWGLHLAIGGGVLAVNQNYGTSDVTDVTHRFRWDAGTRRFLLIGRDELAYHRPQEMYDSVKRSENYLTGVRLVTTGHFGANGRYSETQRPERIPRTRVEMEDVDEVEQD